MSSTVIRRFICLLVFIQIMNAEEEKRISHNDPIVPVEQRQCTDICWLIVYFLLALVIIALGIYAWIAGNFANLTTAYDPDGKSCGVNYPNYPYIYFASPHTNSLWVTVCVSKCPVAGDTVLYCQPNSVVTSCLPKNSTNNANSVEIYPSYVFANTACLPDSATLRGKIGGAFGSSTAAMSSLMQNWSLVLISIPVAIILALIFMLLIRCCATAFIYILIFLAIAALVGTGVYLLVSPTNPVTGNPSGTTGSIIAAVICFVLAFIILLIIICFRRRISLATSIVKVAANFVAKHCTVVLLPVFLFIVMVVFLVVWVLQALGFYSLGPPYTAPHQYPFAHFHITPWLQVLFGFHILFLLWTLMFLVETNTFIIGGTATSWYYNKEDPYGQASQRYTKKHMGSVSFASFMLIFLGILRLIWEALTPQGQDGGCWKKCCDCLCCCCNKLFEWFTTGAFTIINIRATPFCSSGAEAFDLRWFENMGTSSIVAVVQAIFTLLVRLGITFLTVLLIYILAKTVPYWASSVQDATLINLVVGFSAFTISCFFISIYSDSIQAIYMTYLVDMTRGDSENNCPQQLRDFLDEADGVEKNHYQQLRQRNEQQVNNEPPPPAN